MRPRTNVRGLMPFAAVEKEKRRRRPPQGKQGHRRQTPGADREKSAMWPSGRDILSVRRMRNPPKRSWFPSFTYFFRPPGLRLRATPAGEISEPWRRRHVA